MTGVTAHPDLPRRIEAAWLNAPETVAVLSALNRDGVRSRVVGGSVRNTLLREPITDTDLATTARPEQVVELARSAGLAAVATGLEHGTITVIANHVPFEVTTLRRDVETDGRRARVAFTDDWTADARRRDFTVNALYCDADGTLFDPLGGLADVLQRRIRFIGDATARIREDYLRILRFFRFHAAYGVGALDEAGLLACVRERQGLSRLSAERVRVEMLKLLSAPGVRGALAAMEEWGLLVLVLGTVPVPWRLPRLVSIEAALARAPDPALRLAALAVRTLEDAERLTERLRLSNAERDVLADLSGPCRSDPGMSEAAARGLLYTLGPDRYVRRVLLDWASAGREGAEETWRSLAALPGRWVAPPLPVSGRDLLALGMAPGPEIGARLAELEGRWISEDFSLTREELIGIAATHLK